MRISEKDPGTMSAGEINRELDKVEELSRSINEEFIAAGRGHEKPNETFRLSDPLATKWKKVGNRRDELYTEISLRYGPGAPRRLPEHPRGFFGARR